MGSLCCCCEFYIVSRSPSEFTIDHEDSSTHETTLKMIAKNTKKEFSKNLIEELQRQEVVPPSEENTIAASELCSLCFSRRRVCVFIPCGHSSVCFTCTLSLSQCPICRVSIQGLSRRHTDSETNDLQQDHRCKHCGEFIRPFLFDGHQEVCGLRKMQERREEEEKNTANEKKRAISDGNSMAAASDITASAGSTSAVGNLKGNSSSADARYKEKVGITGSSDRKTNDTSNSSLTSHSRKVGGLCRRNKDSSLHIDSSVFSAVKEKHVESGLHSSDEGSHHRCLECGLLVQPLSLHMVVTEPCGHVALCEKCASKKFSCPVCFATIHQYFILYD